jgi:quercetin dioxygenase-like cupin family protein
MTKVMQTPKLLLSNQGNSFLVMGLTFTTKIAAADINSDWVMHEIVGTAGQGAPLHTHPWEETFYVLEGEMEVHVGKRKTLALAGTLLHLPANVAHDFTICSSTVRLLEIIPTFAKSFYEEIGEKITTLPPNRDILQTICDKHGVHFL